ncbi:MAG TPA: hypothetical protein VGP08_01060 [Pyrinomonadaceae bacterium]|jgi:integrase|nr:hypothetical protein [Pyrinomonadaceae bacterium]
MVEPTREEADKEAQGELTFPLAALAAPNPGAALRNAAELWAEQNTRPETLARAEKLRDKVSVVTSFFDFSGRHPGEVTPEDVSRWRAEMERRGLKPATVYARVSRVSAFFRWLMADPQLSRFIRANPAAQARPRYPRPYQSESTKALSDEEMNSLLDAVRRLAGSGSVVGKRDYALLLFYLLTGLRRSEVIGHRGKDLEIAGGSLVIKYRRKGEVHRSRSLRPVRLRGVVRISRGGGAGRRSRDGAAAVDSARQGGEARSATLVAGLRREPEGLRAGGRALTHPPPPDQTHLRADRGRGDREFYRGAGGFRSRERGDD